MKYLKKYQMINESNIETLHERIKETYKNKSIPYIVDLYDAYDLAYDIIEMFNYEDVKFMNLSKINYNGEIIEKQKFILYQVNTTDENEVNDKKEEFSNNFNLESIERIKEMSDNKILFIYNIYIVESSSLFNEGFEYGKLVFLEGNFKNKN